MLFLYTHVSGRLHPARLSEEKYQSIQTCSDAQYRKLQIVPGTVKQLTTEECGMTLNQLTERYPAPHYNGVKL